MACQTQTPGLGSSRRRVQVGWSRRMRDGKCASFCRRFTPSGRHARSRATTGTVLVWARDQRECPGRRGDPTPGIAQTSCGRSAGRQSSVPEAIGALRMGHDVRLNSPLHLGRPPVKHSAKPSLAMRIAGAVSSCPAACFPVYHGVHRSVYLRVGQARSADGRGSSGPAGGRWSGMTTHRGYKLHSRTVYRSVSQARNR